MKTNFVLIDYENVQPTTIEHLNHDHFKIFIFIGAHQTKINLDIASALQQVGERAKYIKISGNGANALDFHIAFYIGQLAIQEPDAYFHIISKDTGFDPLIQHLKSKKILAHRAQDITDIPVVKAKLAASHPEVVKARLAKAHPEVVKARSTASHPEQIAIIITDLQKRGAAKPGTVKTLASTINALFQKKLSESELASLVHELQTREIIRVNDTKVTYTLPT